MMSSVFQGSDDESDLFIVSGDTVISENSSFPCNRSPRHTNGIATEEMNQSFFEQMPVQKATPFPETIRGGLRERSALIRQGLPAIEIHGDIESVNPPERTSSQPALHLGAAEIQKLDPVSPDQRTIVEDLCVMSRRKSIDRLQFVDHAFDDQIQTIYLRKTAEGDLNGSLSMNFAKPFRPKSRCKIVFIHGFLTKPTQFILTLVSAAHHHLVNLIKLLIAQSPLPNGMNDRHTKSNFNEPDSRGKRDLKNAKSHFQFPSFPCPHSPVPFFLLSFLFLPVLTHAAPPRAVLDESHRVFLREHCAACHNADKQKGKVRLDDIPFVLDDIPTADLWQKVLNSVNSGEMPPEDEPQPADEAKAAFLEALSGTLVTARDQLADSGGEIAMRRLNRREYEKTIRDLLGVEINARELPADSGAGTFDTVGSSLFMSSDQFEQYLALGRQAVDEHFARFVAPVPEKEWKLRIEVEGTNQRIIKGLQERSDARERYLQWTAAVDTAAAKPENEELADRIRAEKKGDPRHLHTQWEKIQGAPSPTDFGFTDAIHAEQMGRRDWDHFVPHHRAYVEHPLAKSGSFLTIDDAYVNSRQIFQLPTDWPAGDYVLRVRIAAMDGIPRERRFVEFGPQDPSGVCTVSSTHEVTGTADQPQVLEIPLKLTESKNRLFMFRERGSHESDASASRLFAEARQRNGIGPELALWLDWIEVEKAGVAKPFAKTIRQRREVELHANAMVGGTYNGYFKGGHEAAKKLLETGQPQKGIADEQEAKFRVRAFEEHGPSFERYLNDPLTRTGAYLTIYNVHTEELITLPPDQPSGWLKTKHEVEQAEPGEYVLRFRIGAVKGTPEERHFAELGSRQGGPDDFTLMETFQITGTTEVPQTIELPVSISAGGPRSFVLREKRDVKLDFDTYQAARKETKVGPPPALWIDWIEWEGPLGGANSQNRIPPLLSSSETNPRAVLERFAVRAMRGKTPSATYLDKLAALHDARVKAGEPFDLAIREPLSAILASPGFLYIQEIGTKDRGKGEDPSHSSVPIPLSPPELASRLSYFLWSAPPDEALLAADLTKPDVIAREVDRLIASPKADEFVSGFVHQWLHLDRLDFFQFDTKQFRDFDESAKAAARREVYETFAHLLRNGGSLSRLLKSDEVHVNGLLATYYGIEGVSGDAFRPVKVPPGSPRGGLLGMAAVLAMGSNGERTSPVERGAWVLRYLLHNPPPPAPPNVPQLDRLDGKPVSPRERLFAHQEEPQCLQCHRKIDPIGFGLENFNAAGKWREIDYDPKTKKEWPIDPAGAFHNGPAFKDYFELRDLVAARSDDFARGFTEALIEYGLGRPYGFTDDALAADIVARAKEEDFVVREFILSLVASGTFGKK